MSLAAIIVLVLKLSVLAVVFALGLSARPADLVYVLRNPSALARSLLSMGVVMPLLAVTLVLAMGLPRPVAIMLIALSLAPVPPILPRKELKAGGRASYAVGLLVAAALISIVWIPLALQMIQRVFGVPLEISPARVATVVTTTIIFALVAGVAVGQFAPPVAAKLAPALSQIGSLLLLAAAAVILASQWRAIVALIHDGTLLAFGVFVAVGLLVGHLVGGPDPDDRTVLAMATASRHPGVALAIAHFNFPEEKAVAAAVMLFLLTNTVVSFPYVVWRRRRGAAADLALTARLGS
jgi:BASS family bile acid:Na+ symporter